MKLTLLIITTTLFYILGFHSLWAQDVGNEYSISELSQENVEIVAMPTPSMPRESADTSYTIYEGATVDLVHYFVHGEQYDNIFNPHPTGLFINGEEYFIYCDDEQAVQQQVNMFLDTQEFVYLGRRYLAFISLWESCDGPTCRYRCYNLFDITDPNNITQHSFNSIFQGMDSFGDFNSDGIIDYVRVGPKAPEGSIEDGTADFYYYITAYTLANQRSRQLYNDEHSNYYLYAYGDEYVDRFEILEADWFFTVKDTSGQAAKSTPYFAPYVSFDPFEPHLYDANGFRQEKRRYTIQVTSLGDVDGAISEVEALNQKINRDVYILPDQYSGDITFRVVVGNFLSKELAVGFQKKLQGMGIEGQLYDFKRSY